VARTHGPLVVIVGPTAVGKTTVSLYLAKALEGEIVSADSRQVYRGMDVGTDKATPSQRALVPHHLLGIRSPDEPLSLAEYQRLAYAAIDDILDRGRLPFLVGGSGQYVLAVLEGWGIPEVPPDEALRARLEMEAEQEGYCKLHARLQAMDPVAASRIDPRNVRRVIRALEVCLKTGQRISDLQSKRPPPYDLLWLGLTLPRALLYQRVDERVEQMIAAGLVAEVERLLTAGYSLDMPAMSGLGYRQIGDFLQGRCTLEEAIQAIKHETHRFVRQQYTWFRLNDPRIRWYDLSVTDPDQILADVQAWLNAERSGNP